MPTLADIMRAYDWMNSPQIPREMGAPGMKGLGYFGALPRPGGGISTELAGEQDGLYFPLMVPTLTKEELDLLLSGGRPTETIWKKAREHAILRGQSGKDPFATMYDQQIPRP